MRLLRYAIGVCLCVAALSRAPAQEAPPSAPARVLGEVVSSDPARRQLTLKTAQGGTLAVVLDDRTVYLRVPPGEKDLSHAVPIALSGIAAGDRVLARGRFAEDRQSLAAASVIVMTKTDLVRKQQRDREEWQRRGVAGTVTAVNPATGQITIAVTAAPKGSQPLQVQTGATTGFLRYAPDSVRFSDARPGTLADLQPGDHLRALGDRDSAGSFHAEQVVSGAFRNVAATVKSVNAAAGELTITDLATRKPLTVKINADSMVRRLPPDIAAMLAHRVNREDSSGPNRRPSGNGPARSSDPQQLLERMPALPLAELKPGDAVIVSSTRGADPQRITAITLVAGVEPLLTAPESARPPGGAWNFGDIGLPE